MDRNRSVSAIFLFFVLALTTISPASLYALSQEPLASGFDRSTDAMRAHAQAKQSDETTYPWPMNGHDYQRTFYTDSAAPSTPNLLWKAKMSGPPSFGPIVAEGKVFHGTCNDGDVYAWDANSGELNWTRHLNNTVQGISYFNGKLYCAGGTLPHDPFTRDTGDVWVCLDAKNGTTIWTYHIPEHLMLRPEQVGSAISEITVYKSKAYVRVKDGYVILDPDTGAVISEWLDGFGNSSRCPSFYESDIFGVYNYTRVYRADPQTREIKWMSPPLFGPSSDVWGYMLVSLSSGQVYLPGDLAGGRAGEPMQNSIYRLDAQNGFIYWKFLAGDQVNSIAVAYNRLLFGCSDGYFYCLDKFEEYTPYWKFKTHGAILADPAVADEKVYFGSFDNYIYCLNITSGELIWKYKTGSSVAGNAAIADGKLYISSNDQYVYCFGPRPPRPRSSILLSTPSKITIGESVSISGKLTDQAGASLGNANVTLRYRVFPVIEWTNIKTVTTASDGSFTYTWTPPYEGFYYEFSAIYTGDAYEPSFAESTVKVAAAPEIPPYVIFVSITGAIALGVAAVCIIALWYTTKKRSQKTVGNEN